MSSSKGRVVKACVQAGIGLMLVMTALVCYWGYFQYFYELTFLSNFLAGIFFLLAAMRTARGRDAPQVLYLCFTVLLFLVFVVCMAFLGSFTITGVFAFVHIVNPLAVTAYFLAACGTRGMQPAALAAPLAMPLAYLVFALFFGAATGNHIYFFLDYQARGIWYTVLFILAAGVFLILVSALFVFLNRCIHKKWG